MSPEPICPYPPGEQEKAEYYDGLRDQPRLIARTSATPFVPNGTRDRYQFDQHCKKREPVAGHDIITKYSQAFAADIISTLDDYPWHRFYPIRIIDYMAMGKPVIFIIETLTDSEPWETSIQAALSCRNVIHSMGITDVEVEIQQVIQVPFAVTKELEAFTDSTEKAAASAPSTIDDNITQSCLRQVMKNLIPFSSHIGYEIQNPGFRQSGTMGLHLRLGETDASYGLTCRHVVLDKASNPSVDINIDTSGDKSMLIRQLTQHTAATLVDGLVTLENHYRKGYQALAKKVEEWDNWYSRTDETAEAKQSRCPTSEERERLPRLNSAVSQVTKAAGLALPTPDQSRIIGHVAYASSYAKSSRGYLLDWALVELDTAKCFATQPTNKVHINPAEAKHRDYKIFNEDLDSPQPILFRDISKLQDHIDDNGFLQITRVVPTPIDGKAARLAVGMQGMKSGLNFGMTNEILAVRRDFTGRGLVVWEWIVFCEKNHTCFSAEGDSGTAVWDHTGGFVGMITGGAAISETSWHNESCAVENSAEIAEASNSASFRVDARRDLTFVTTAEYLFESIKEFTGRTPHIL
ncbi:hypothetical protein GGI35DRAFT_487411 [Trichoderma velutinum]